VCGVNVRATWVGDGSMLPTMRAIAESRGIADRVLFPGIISDRTQLLRTIQRADIFLFCHKTLESARCLGEALACGCPLVGYAGAYAVDLVKDCGGGLFAGQGDWGGLAEIVQDLEKNRGRLAELITQASVSGQAFDRDALMQKRMDLLKTHLIPLAA
jgi:glycosyltransferase involved in cell wall biosynthesis